MTRENWDKLGYVNNRPDGLLRFLNLLLKKHKYWIHTKLIKSSSQSKTNGCICNIKVIISLFFDDTTFRVYAHYEFQCLSFLCVVVAVVIAICVLVFMWICFMCVRKNRTPTQPHEVRNARPHKVRYAHTPARGAKRTPTHTFFILSSVCCYEKSGFYIILSTPFYWAIIIFFFIFFWQMLKMAERNLEKIQQAFLRILFLESVTKSSK